MADTRKPSEYLTESAMFDLAGEEGVNESERILTGLCRKSFLRLWAHANVYTDAGLKEKSKSTKELCDALVIFGSDVLVFSDKDIKYHVDKPTDVAWSRWYKRAVIASIEQLHGAHKWLLNFPSKAFLDPLCSRQLPVAVPSGNEARFHLIAVTRGGKDAALAINHGLGHGTFGVDTEILGNAHFSSPFVIGRPVPEKHFVHVFDEVSIQYLMQELDTAPDFIEYLKERERVLSDPNMKFIAQGEEDLLALYMTTMDADETKHMFFSAPPEEAAPTVVLIEDGIFDELRDDPAYQRKKAADKISYLWDEIVSRFIRLGDPSLHAGFADQDKATSEQGLRLLAGESRFRRRQLARALVEVLNSVGPGQRIGRVVYSGIAGESVFVFLVVSKRDDESYDEYRQYRAAVLHAYCRIAKLQAPLGTVFVGVSMDNPHKNYRGGSEDMLVWTQDTWLAEDIAELERMRDELGILGQEVKVSRRNAAEFPAFAEPTLTPPASVDPAENGERQRSSDVQRKAEKRRRKMQQASKRRNR